jgi:hypothetical protein
MGGMAMGEENIPGIPRNLRKMGGYRISFPGLQPTPPGDTVMQTCPKADEPPMNNLYECAKGALRARGRKDLSVTTETEKNPADAQEGSYP